MLFRVPGARSSLGLPGTVTLPGFAYLYVAQGISRWHSIATCGSGEYDPVVRQADPRLPQPSTQYPRYSLITSPVVSSAPALGIQHSWPRQRRKPR